MDKYSHRRERGGSNPSFSSTLLDTIYRSIDEGEKELVLYKETMRTKKQLSSSLKGNNGCFKDEEEMANFQRICMIEKWMEKKEISQKVIVRRRSLADFAPKAREHNRDAFFFNSSSSSSDSSSGGRFSSSEAESVYGVSSGSSCYGLQKPKPIRTSVSVQQEKSKLGKQLNMYGDDYQHGRDYAAQQKPKHEGGFTKTKSRALKIYGDLKKAKQPISPGGKLASFLNSLFSAGNAKKAKIISKGDYDHASNSERKSKSAKASTCSSASSFSRSCLSKTPSSRGKSSHGMKRSVRFVDEDCQPCKHKNLYEDKPSMEAGKETRSSINEELKLHIMEKNRRVEEAARDLLRNYQKRVELEYDSRTIHVKSEVFDNGDEEEEDDDDAASCASSDLFELDNLSAIGMVGRYQEELPVYETTHLDTNRAIANGIIL